MTVHKLPGTTDGGEQPPPHISVVRLENTSKLDLEPEVVLKAALDRDLDCVVILGYDKDGEEYFAGTCADGGTVVWMLERAKLQLLRMVDDGKAKFTDRPAS